MLERLICAALIIPAFLFLGIEFDEKHKRLEIIWRIFSEVGLIFLAMYLGIVLPQ